MPTTVNDIGTLRALTKGLRAEFFDAFNAELATSIRGQIATEIRTNSEGEDYAWLGSAPSVREFTDERQVKALTGYSFYLANKVWENTIGVDRAALDHDKLGMIMPRIRDLGIEAARYQDQLVMEVLAAGNSTLCYDGQYLIDTDHSSGDSGTQSNSGTTALSVTSLQAAMTAMRKFKNDRGVAMGIRPNLLVVPPDLAWTAQEIVGSPNRPDTAVNVKNVLSGMLQVHVSPYLTDTNNWYLMDTTRGMKPLIFQLDAPVEFQSQTEESESGFMRAQYMYGTYARYNAGPGLWQCVYGAIVT